MSTKHLRDDDRHGQHCHDRWMKSRNRRTEDPAYQDDWYETQCGTCRYFVPLMGVFIDDWGACTNPDSEFDRRVMFEHDGCDAFEQGTWD